MTDPGNIKTTFCHKNISKESFTDIAEEKYQSIALLPSITNGRIYSVNSDFESITCSFGSTYSQRDLKLKEFRKFDKFYTSKIEFKSGLSSQTTVPFQSEKHNIVIESVSNDANWKAIVRKVQEKDVETFYLEIWSNNGLGKSFNLTDLKKHGHVYSDVTFSSLQWSNDCTKLLYIAEKKKKESSLSSGNISDSEKENAVTDKKQWNIGNEEKFLYEESWGEQKTTIHHPVIVVLNVISGDLEVIQEVPDNISPGQCIWGPNDSIVFTGWWHAPFRLGLIYCENRRSAIFQLECKENKKHCIQLSDDNCAVHSARISPDGSKMIYLERAAGGPHRGCERLVMYDFLSKRKPSIVYDIVDCVSENKIALFCYSLPQRCWLKNGKLAIMHSNFKTNKIIVLIEIATGNLTRITNEDGSWTILDTMSDFILASFATPNQPHCLRLGYLKENIELTWFNLDQGICNPVVADIKWEKFLACTGTDQDGNDEMECILILPTTSIFGSKPPLIVWPHGGPHTVMTADFMVYQAVFSTLGFAVLLVNYRGSVGFGERPLRSLLGKVGKQDVYDVQKAAELALESDIFNKDCCFVFGGSHGGFLAAHLIGEFPDFYKGCILRNPVINMASMVEVTDIPDWCYTEIGVMYTHDTLPSAGTYSKMLESSPIFHVRKVHAPVLILLGGSDARVPPSQGRSFFRALKSMEKEVKLLWYPEDCHPINKVESEASALISIVNWLHSHI